MRQKTKQTYVVLIYNPCCQAVAENERTLFRSYLTLCTFLLRSIPFSRHDLDGFVLPTLFITQAREEYRTRIKSSNLVRSLVVNVTSIERCYFPLLVCLRPCSRRFRVLGATRRRQQYAWVGI